eukprot:3857507-Pyramimonas_sp.AAC.1
MALRAQLQPATEMKTRARYHHRGLSTRTSTTVNLTRQRDWPETYGHLVVRTPAPRHGQHQQGVVLTVRSGTRSRSLWCERMDNNMLK